MLVSTFFDTRLFSFAERTMSQRDPTEFPGFSYQFPTLLASNLLCVRFDRQRKERVYEDHSLVVQVTRHAVTLVNMLTRVELARQHWTEEVTGACNSASQVCVALQSGSLMYMEVRDEAFQPIMQVRVICSDSFAKFSVSAVNRTVGKALFLAYASIVSREMIKWPPTLPSRTGTRTS